MSVFFDLMIQCLNMIMNDIKIESLSHDGRGIARINGKTSFIRNALPNETVRAQRIKIHKRFDEYEALDIITASAERISPSCAYYEQCGGCQLQHLSHTSQLEYKQRHVLEQIKRSSGLQTKHVYEPITAQATAYRTRARLSAWFDKSANTTRIGFRAHNQNTIIHITHCEVLHPALNRILSELPKLSHALKLGGALGHFELHLHEPATKQNNDSTLEPQAALGIRVLTTLAHHQTQTLLDFAQSKGCVIGVQTKESTWRTLTHDGELLGKSDDTEDDSNQHFLAYTNPTRHANHRLQFNWDNFTQANRGLNAAMTQRAIAALTLETNDRVLDAFCGIGNFSFAVAEQVAHVDGIEGRAETVAMAQRNQTLNNVHNLAFHHRNLMTDDGVDRLKRFDFNKALIDPPREGAQALCAYLAKRKIKRIVYISCSPAHLARDAKTLANAGYQLASLSLCDMFPNTSHSEVIACFTRK